MQTWIRRRSALAGLALVGVTLAATPLAAQEKATVGFLAGASFTTLTGTDSSVSTSSSTGFAGGVYLGIPVARSLVLEPEVLYANKGAGIEGTGETLNLNYIEIPVLLRYQFTPDGGAFAYLGPYVGFNVKCNTVVDTLPTTCTDQSLQPNTVFGGAIGVGFQKEAFGFDLRYEYDFTSAFQDEKGRNSAFMVLIRVAVN